MDNSIYDTFNVYINSKFLNNGQLKINIDKYDDMYFNWVNIAIPRSWYLINENYNDKIYLKIDDDEYEVTLIPGNYSYLSLIEMLDKKFKIIDGDITVQKYDEAYNIYNLENALDTYKIQFLYIGESVIQIKVNQELSEILGLNVYDEYINLNDNYVSPNLCNLNSERTLYLILKNCMNNKTTSTNFKNNNNNSDILTSIYIHECAFGSYAIFNNNDIINTRRKFINSDNIIIDIVNENNTSFIPFLQGLDFSIHLVFFRYTQYDKLLYEINKIYIKEKLK